MKGEPLTGTKTRVFLEKPLQKIVDKRTSRVFSPLLRKLTAHGNLRAHYHPEIRPDFEGFLTNIIPQSGTTWVVPPPSNSHHQDYYIFRLGDPNLNLHLPRLHPGRGDNPKCQLQLLDRGTQNGWFIMENHIKMDDLGVPPLFLVQHPHQCQLIEVCFLLLRLCRESWLSTTGAAFR